MVTRLQKLAYMHMAGYPHGDFWEDVNLRRLGHSHSHAWYKYFHGVDGSRQIFKLSEEVITIQKLEDEAS